MDTDDKTVRDAGVRAIVDEFEATLDEEYKEEHGANLGECVDKLQKKIVRRWLANGKRVDGRGMEEVRPLAAEVHVLPRVHGSGMFTRGQTQVLTLCTLGTLGDAQGAGHHLRGEGEALYPPLQLPVLLRRRDEALQRPGQT